MKSRLSVLMLSLLEGEGGVHVLIFLGSMLLSLVLAYVFGLAGTRAELW